MQAEENILEVKTLKNVENLRKVILYLFSKESIVIFLHHKPHI